MLIAPDELRHLAEGPRPSEYPGGAGLLGVRVTSRVPVVEVIARTKAVLQEVVHIPAEEFATAWQSRLPSWFIDGCVEEPSAEANEAWLKWWRQLDSGSQQRAARERGWSIADWMHWMHPMEREWFWWHAQLVSQYSAEVQVEVQGWPPAVGALEWLLRVAGAESVDSATDS